MSKRIDVQTTNNITNQITKIKLQNKQTWLQKTKKNYTKN